jgi:shikimate kinase
MQLFDIDREIENKTKITIKEIFKRDGEEKFRRLEREEIAKLKTQNIQNHVISCGGGAILDPKNRKTIKENTIVVWLWANPKTIVARVKGDQNRPLLNVPDSEKANVIARLLEGRRRFYAETADIIIDTTAKTPEQVAERILYEIHKTR